MRKIRLFFELQYKNPATISITDFDGKPYEAVYHVAQGFYIDTTVVNFGSESLTDNETQKAITLFANGLCKKCETDQYLCVATKFTFL